MPRIAILCSFSRDFGSDPLYTRHFQPQLPGGTQVDFFNANGDYDNEAANNRNIKQVADTINPANYDLLVAAGGLVSAIALAKSRAGAAKPFLIIVGDLPNHPGNDLSNNNNLIGGINLHTANQNNVRAGCLWDAFGPSGTISHRITSLVNICLYYNGNSHSHDKESGEFLFRRGKALKSTVDQTTAGSVQAQFAADFAGLPQGTEAIVVAADPFFAARAADLAAALTAVIPAIPVCYPTERFSMADPAISLIYGPNLGAAYETLGRMASRYLNATVKPPYLGIYTPPPIGPIPPTAP